ncbi:MAG: Ig-like domain-containing protein, partial [Gemmatimonadota bacterium]
MINESDAVDRIVLTPNRATLEAGSTMSFSAAVLNAAGDPLSDRRVVWTSEDDAIATVSQAGGVIAIAGGATQVAASSGGKSARATVTVTSRPVTLVRITPGSARLSVNNTLPLKAEALDAAGEVVKGVIPTWSSSNAAVASVDSGGVVTGIAPGSAVISATVAGRVGSAAIAVSPQAVASVRLTAATDTIFVGGRSVFRAHAVDAAGASLPDRFVMWTSDSPSIAAVSSAGEVFGLAVGTARIRATIESRFAEVAVQVTPVPVRKIDVAPNKLTLSPRETAQLTVTLRDSAGNELLNRSVAYRTTDAQIATVSHDGLVIAVAAGTAQIEVVSEAVRSIVDVKVQLPPVAAVVVTPNASALRIGEDVQLVAQPQDARGTALSGRTISWRSSAPAVATVSQSGVVSAIAPGSATISATSEGVQGAASVTVTLIAAASVVISPKPVALLPAQSQQLTLLLADSAGRPLSESGRSVTWISRNSAVASVSLVGLVTAVAAGRTRIVVATANAIDSADVVVAASPSTTLALQPTIQSLLLGEIRALRAMVTSGGTIVRGRPIAWQSSAPAIVSVSAVPGWPDSASVSALSLGSAFVSAVDSTGARDSTLVAVASLPVASVTVSPAKPTVLVGGTVQLSAIATDSTGATHTPVITWSSVAPSVASVSSSGLVTASSTGTAAVEARAVGAGARGQDVVGTASVDVVPAVGTAAVHSVIVTSPRSFVVARDSMHLTVVLRDAQSNILTGRSTTFSSSSNSRMSVDASGVVTGAGSSGHADIVVTSEGKTGKVRIASTASVASMNVSGPTNSARDLLIARGTAKR